MKTTDCLSEPVHKLFQYSSRSDGHGKRCWSPRDTAAIISVAMFLVLGVCAAADEKPKFSEKPLMAFVPPTVRVVNAAPKDDTQITSLQIMAQVVPRVANDATKKKWPFKIMPPETVDRAIGEVAAYDRQPDDDAAPRHHRAPSDNSSNRREGKLSDNTSNGREGKLSDNTTNGSDEKLTDDPAPGRDRDRPDNPAPEHESRSASEVAFSDLKPLAEKIDCRYLVVFHVNELRGVSRDELFSHTLHARANVDLQVYDRDKDAYVWHTNKVSVTRHPQRPGKVGLRREEDGALNAALTAALEPFAQGERTRVERTRPERRTAEGNTLDESGVEGRSDGRTLDARPVEGKPVERPKLNMVVIVQKVLGDGRRVLVDAGRDYNVRVGDTFRSVESDLEIKIIEVLDNGSIAEVTAGSPKDREVLKHK